MARPKGVKNKSTDDSVEFNYEDSDALYRHVMSTGAAASGPMRDEIDLALQTAEPVVYTAAPAPAVFAQSPSLIYLVEGKVRLDQDGSPPIVADQRRIVNAANVDEALNKFVNYFVGMSNPIQRYSVVQAAASETIL